MLHLHHSNRPEALAAQWLAAMATGRAGRDATAVLFEPVPVIVPNAALERWLTLQLADHQGIAAGVEFSYLARWLWQQIAAWLPDVGAASPFAPDVLAWRIHAAFGDVAWRSPYTRLAGYLDQADDVMRLDLAQRTARLYDQYLTYRPDWLAWWRDGEQGPPPAGLEGLGPRGGAGAEDAAWQAAAHGDAAWQAAAAQDAAWQAAAAQDAAWQAALWRRLSQELRAAPRHPVETFAEALRQATPAQVQAAALPPEVHVFMLPAIPPLYLGLLQTLSRWTELHVHLLNPCQEYWFEIVDPRRLARLEAEGRQAHHETAHPVLASWGRAAQAALAQWVEVAGDGTLDDALWVDPGDAHLLALWQRSVLTLEPLPPGSVALDDADRSIEAHVCHSPVRELEVLHDTLLSMFSQPQAPAPGEVLVVTPDLEAMAPLIDAVFGTVPVERHIPYVITGRGRSRANGIAAALLDVLALLDSRLPVTALMGLLQRAPVARRFRLDAAALERLHRWLREADVHWALDAEHRASQGLPASARYTLSDGLARLFLGYALPDDLAAPYDGRLAAGDAEGQDAATLGSLWQCVDALDHWRGRLRVAPLPAQWPALLGALQQAFVRTADEGSARADDADDLREWQAAIQALAQRWAAAGHEAPVSLDVLRSALAAELDDPARGGVPSGAVTFSSMASLRGVPYRVIAALGLQDGAFPGSDRPAEFDLMARAPRRGDRQRRLDERQLFLDLLLAARDRVILSWTGRSVRDNAALPPSVLVAEWLDALVPVIADDPADRAALAQARARLVVEHPLQAFSPRAFGAEDGNGAGAADERRRSHDQELAAALREAARVRAAAATATAVEAFDADERVPAADGDAVDGDGERDGSAVEGDASDADDAIAADRLDDIALAPPFFTQPLPPPPEALRHWTLDGLIRALRHPARALLRHRLGVVLDEDEAPLDDDEPLVPDAFARHRLADRLLPALLGGLDDARLTALAAAGTEFPDSPLGERARAREQARLRAYADEVLGATAEPSLPAHTATLTLDVDGEPWTVTGSWSDLRPHGLVRHRYGRGSGHDVLAAWLHHLLRAAVPAAGAEPRTTWILDGTRWVLRPCADPRATLTGLLRVLREALSGPVAFLPRSGWTLLSTGSRSKALQTWAGSSYGETVWPGERDDAALQLVWRGRGDPFHDPAFDALAHAVYQPVLDHLEPA